MHFETEELELINTTEAIPSISIIVQVEPKITLKAEALKAVNLAVVKVRKFLESSYPEQMYQPVMKNLERAVEAIDYELLRKSIAIFASPTLAKVFYLEIPVKDKIVVNASFEIRDLVYARQPSLNYLALFVNGREAKIFLCDNEVLIRLNMDMPGQLAEYENDVAERVTNFSDPSERKEVILDKYLRHVDGGLSKLLNFYKLPVFLVGVDRVTGHFRKISSNNEQIAGVISGNYYDFSLPEIKKLLQPKVDEWREKRSTELLGEITRAEGTGKLAAGIHAVWKAVREKNCRLLIVEKDFVYPEKGDSGVYTRDAVDDIIHEVIKEGGEVRFVNKDLLKNYGRIVLLRYF